MTVSSQTSTATFVGNGVATAFPLPFRFFENGDIRAYFIDSVTGAAAQMVLGTDYTLIGAGEPEVDGNALSLLTTTVPLASMRGLYVERFMPQTQSTDLVNQGEFFASTHEDVFDRLTMLIQQQVTETNKAKAEADEALAIAQEMVARQEAFENNYTYVVIGAYDAGLQFTSMNQVFSYDAGSGAEFYAPGPSITLPYTTTGIGAAEIATFRSVGDAVPRGDLSNFADKSKGSALLGRGVVAVDSISDLLSVPESARKGHLRYLVKMYHSGEYYLPDSYSGGGEFFWSDSCSKSLHNGGTYIDPSKAFPDWSIPDDVNSWLFPSSSGDGCWVRLHSYSEVHVDCFGAVAGNSTLGAQNYHVIRKALESAITHPTRLEGQRRVLFGCGEYFILGNSPLMFNRSEMTALSGGYRYRRGLAFAGIGKGSTIITLQSSGTGESWFYDTYDANFPSDSSVADYVTYSGITFRGKVSIQQLSTSNKTSGFRWITHGWEKYMSFRDCAFENLDTAFVYDGYGNADHNQYFGCSFLNIRDRMFYMNNNQAVATRFIGCDAELIRGHGFAIGPQGGGDVYWCGGSIILYPQVDGDDMPLDTQPNFGFVSWDNSGVTSGPSSGPGNNLYVFEHVRFETYSEYQSMALGYRADATVYGGLRVVYRDCSMVQAHKYKGDWGVPLVPYPATILENDMWVLYERCTLSSAYTHRIAKHNGRIEFADCEYIRANPVEDTEFLKARCSIGSAPGAVITARGTVVDALVANASFSGAVLPDFTLRGGSGMYSSRVVRQAKVASTPWPQPGHSGPLRFYLPAGSVISRIAIQKPAEALPAPSSNYGLRLVSPLAEQLVATSVGAEGREILFDKLLSTPFKVYAAPNNWVEIGPVGTGSSQAFSNTYGDIVFEYV